jgi:hypothetical protein
MYIRTFGHVNPPRKPLKSRREPSIPEAMKAIVGALLLAACAGVDGAEDSEQLDAEQIEQPQTADCRPVRTVGCGSFDNDRSCFHVPPGCAVDVEQESDSTE